MLSYPLWLILFVLLPITILWTKNWESLRPYIRICVVAIFGALLVSLPWDYVSIQERIWYFEQPHIIGLWFLGLPIEEWLFIVLTTLLFTTTTLLLHMKYTERKYVQ